MIQDPVVESFLWKPEFYRAALPKTQDVARDVTFFQIERVSNLNSHLSVFTSLTFCLFSPL